MKIVPLIESQITLAGEMMARAFFDEPLSVHMLPNAEQRARVLPWHFTSLIRYAQLFGETYATDADVDGVCAWLPPSESEWESTPERLEQAGLHRSAEVLGEVAWQRYLHLSHHTETLRRMEVPSRHWFLALIAVNPLRQGEGIGGALLQPVLRWADKEGTPAYLWTDQPRTVPFYRRQGFAVVTEVVETDSGIRFWTMRREPRKG